MSTHLWTFFLSFFYGHIFIATFFIVARFLDFVNLIFFKMKLNQPEYYQGNMNVI